MPDSPTDLLTNRVLDIESGRATDDDWKRYTNTQHAFNCAATIAINCVRSAARAGNVQCQQAQREMNSFLAIIFNNRKNS